MNHSPCSKISRFSVFETLHDNILTQLERRVKSFQCDNGREYNNSWFHNFCKTHGMISRFSCPHKSSKNEKAESKICNINNIVRTLLLHSSMPPHLWRHHVLAMATYLHNMLPTKLLHNISPTHILYYKSPRYEQLWVFGCLCHPLFPSKTINKL